jgi:hypothetical protein
MLNRPLLSLLACAVLLVLLAACSAQAEDFGPVVNAFEQSRLERGAHEMYRMPSHAKRNTVTSEAHEQF